jgi:hypothetical protein
VGFVSSAARSDELSDDSDNTDMFDPMHCNVNGQQCADLEPAYANIRKSHSSCPITSKLSNQLQPSISK